MLDIAWVAANWLYYTSAKMRVYNPFATVTKPAAPVSINLTAWKEPDIFLSKTLESLAEQNVVKKYPEMFELLIVGAEGINLELVRQYTTRIIVAQKGKLSGRAEGIHESAGEIIVACDSDSVPGYSPVVLRRGQSPRIDCTTFEELWDSLYSLSTEVTLKGEEIKSFSGLEVYSGWNSGSRYTKVKRLVRHPYDGRILRFTCVGGLFDVTPNHSIIRFARGGHQIVDASKIAVGARLSAPSFKPKPNDNQRFYYGTADSAWLFGFFAAEGCACLVKSKDRGGRDIWDVSLSNNNRQLLERSEKAISNSFNLDRSGFGTRDEDGRVPNYSVHYRSKELYDFFRPRFYNKYSLKRVPGEILSAPTAIQEAFLQGYFDGDGSLKTTSSFQKFSTNSWLLAQGLLILVASTMGNSFSVESRDDKPNIVSIVLNKGTQKVASQNPNWKERGLITKIRELEYHGYVYDFETEEQAFNTGVGQIRVHNSYYPPNWMNMTLQPFQDPKVIAVETNTDHGKPIVDRVFSILIRKRYTENMLGRGSAFRKEAFYAMGGFDLSINQNSMSELLREEEYEFMRKLQTVGEVSYVNAPMLHLGEKDYLGNREMRGLHPTIEESDEVRVTVDRIRGGIPVEKLGLECEEN